MGTGLICDGQRIAVGDLDVTNWLDNPRLRLGPGDFRRRGPSEAAWVHLIVLHTTKGIPGGGDQRPQVIRPGFGPGGDAAERVVRFWTGEERGAGAHLIVDFDGAVFCCADLRREASYHAGHANGASVGIEIVQGRDAELYEGQLDATVRLCDALTRLLGIQRQVPHRYLGPLPRMTSEVGDVVGVIGHRDLTNRRGAGDPGSAVFYRLGQAGYEDYDFALSADRDEWRRRQRALGMLKADGIAGPATVEALKAVGKPHGLWVARPGD